MSPLEWIRRGRVVPVIRAPTFESALSMVDSLLKGGIDVAEITMTVPGAADAIRQIRSKYGGACLVGAGTVLDGETANKCIDAGAQFIVSPGLVREVLAVCKARKVFAIQGALTPTEVLEAWRAGSEMVKIFPCDAMGGWRYVQALRAPFPDIPLLPTGGVNLENIPAYLVAGADAVGVGSNLCDPKFDPGELVNEAWRYAQTARRQYEPC